MDEEDRRYVIAELDALAKEVAHTIQKLENSGVTSIMKDDYVALHVLAHRVMEMRLQHLQAIDLCNKP